MLDNILIAMQSLRTNKMRALLTMLGIIIGIASVIAIETVGNSLSGSITDSMSGFGASDISISLTQKESGDQTTSGNIRIRMFQNSTPGKDDRITDQMINEYREAFPTQVSYIKISENAGSGSYGPSDDPTMLIVTGINDEYLPGEQIEIIHGRSIDNSKDAQRKLCVVADKFVSDTLGISPVNAIGQSLSLKINNRPYTFYIIGVYRYEDDATMSMSSDDIVTSLYIPLETAKTLSGSTQGYSSITIVTSQGTDTTAFLSTSESFFSSYYTRNDTWTVSASSMETLISTMTDMLDTVSLAISAIAAISLLVGGIGVMNIMLVSVTERTREIGIRKALGAPGWSIRLQFIVESTIICLIGGIIGILTGTGLGAVACRLLGYSAHADLWTILLVVGISMGIGIFFGYYPANKASKLDPIEALRYE